jgi:NADH dehydrogenase
MKVAVTGAFGYSGRYIARRLLQAGAEVITLTNSPHRPNEFHGQVRAFPFNFDRPELLSDSLKGVDALINTYWVRFDHRTFTHQGAVANTLTLFQAAKAAGVRRIVHTSITNPDVRSPLPYFRGKAELESALERLGVSFCILRPAILFGPEDILINNICWSLRHLPVFGVFGDGEYKLQPIYVDDFAQAAVDHASNTASEIINAIGPETLTYRGLVELLRNTLGLRRWIISVPPGLGYLAGRLLGWFLGDVVITREEIRGLMEGRLAVEGPALGRSRLSDWAAAHRESLGQSYASEMRRRRDRSAAYH